MTLTLTFLGGTNTVTGSRTLVEAGRDRLLVDCGLFQGFKALRLLNWRPVPVDPARLDAVLLTHAHIDHSGALPLLVRQGFRGPIHTTAATADLCRILWPDAAWLQEEEAERANRKGYSKHRPAQPLFTVADAERAAELLVPHRWGDTIRVGDARATFGPSGHILGASTVLVEAGGRRVLFSGDLGRAVDPMHAPPPPPVDADAVVLESTYGNRSHVDVDPEEALGEVVRRTVARGGHVIVPAFAVGRTQRLLLHLLRLRRRGEIPHVPIFLNSPLASRATEVFLRHPAAHALSEDEARGLAELPIVVESPEESRALNRRKEPCVIIAGSGMATGGRVVHHLRAFAPDPRHTVLFSGFQAGGTRGDRMLRGETELKIFGEYVPVRCEVALLDNLSAHADQDELVGWLRRAERPPGRVLLNHGEAEAADALRLRVAEELELPVEVPLMGDVVTL